MGHQVPIWVVRSLYGSSERLCAHESSESLQGCPFMGHQVPLWVIRFVNAIGCTTYDYVTNLIMEMILYKYMNLF
ncbi:hypothetical protein LOK49_LG05G02452 [Camellia lanceoleosa]|uniref:Uncharacterized protein n=1 Tax=Camellia lanceoleosa TaxID=1840588 RepID=A0ACC0HSD2_9ERIC|nr:hypothetical protein LOK49_LG05G02452 [Camellia lanceoleosa]